jgi:hypothetical protein
MIMIPLKITVRRMKATIKQIESVVNPSGNSGHLVVSLYTNRANNERRKSRTYVH